MSHICFYEMHTVFTRKSAYTRISAPFFDVKYLMSASLENPLNSLVILFGKLLWYERRLMREIPCYGIFKHQRAERGVNSGRKLPQIELSRFSINTSHFLGLIYENHEEI